ncbi:MAG: WD40 repeat domain-containing protein [Anaerolineae bacterium]|nr:WD40 repeat domain-containing protein [Anaerolineae bacterium]
MDKSNRRAIVVVAVAIGLLAAVLLGLLRASVQESLRASPSEEGGQGFSTAPRVVVITYVVGSDSGSSTTPILTPAPTFTPSPTPTPLPTPTPTPTPKPIQLSLERRVNDGAVINLAYSPDGKSLAVLSTTGIQLYDGESLSKRRTLDLKADPEHAFREEYIPLVFSPDSQMLASVDQQSSKVLVWRTSDGSLLHSFETAILPREVVFSTDGKELIFTAGPRIAIQPLDGSKPVRTLSGHTGEIVDIAISADGQWLVSASEDNTVRRWSLNESKPEAQVVAQAFGIRGVALSKDGSLLGYFDSNAARILRVSDSSTVLELGKVRDLIFLPTEPQLLLAPKEGWSGVEVRQLPEGTLIPLPLKQAPLARVSASLGGKKIALAYASGTVELVQLPETPWRRATRLPAQDYRRRLWSEDGEWVALETYDSFMVWDTVGNKSVATLRRGFESAKILSRKNEALLVSTSWNELLALALANGGIIHRFEGELVGYNRKADLIAVKNGDRIAVYGLADGKSVGEVEVKASSYTGIRVYAGKRIAVLDGNKLSIGSLQSGRLESAVTLPERGWTSDFRAFVPAQDEKLLYVLHTDRLVKVDLDTQTHRVMLSGDRFCSYDDDLHAALVSDGAIHVFTTSGCIYSFDIATDRLLSSANVYASSVTPIAFPGGQVVFVQEDKGMASRFSIQELQPRSAGTLLNYSSRDARGLGVTKSSGQATVFYSGYYDTYQLPAWNRIGRDTSLPAQEAVDFQVDAQGQVALVRQQRYDSNVVLWKIAQQESILVPDALSRQAALSSDGQTFVALVKKDAWWSAPKEVGLWRTSDGLLLRKVPLEQPLDIAALALSSDGSRIASLDLRGNVSLQKLPQGEVEAWLLPNREAYLVEFGWLYFSGDGRLLVATYRDNRSAHLAILIWAISERTSVSPEHLFGALQAPVHALGFSVGDLVAIALPGEIRVADTQGKFRGSAPIPHHIPPVKLVFSQDERQLMSLHPDGVVLVWQLTR